MALEEDLLRLAELGRHAVRAVLEGNREDFPRALGAYFEFRNELKRRLLAEPVVSVSDAEAADILRKITTGDGLPSDAVIERLSSQMEEGDQLTDLDDYDIEELGSELFYSWFSHHEYITGLAELRPLIVRASASAAVASLVRQVKNCYAFQQYEAAFTLCRVVIEASVRDICVKRNLFPDLGDNVLLFEHRNWRQLRDNNGPLRNLRQEVYSSKIFRRRPSVVRDKRPRRELIGPVDHGQAMEEVQHYGLG